MFPSVLNTFNRPAATDRLNSPSHSALHNTVSSALGQVEAVIGINGANSVVGTMMYDLRSPASGGGGHVQAVNKGGTGLTSYTKGDVLVAQSSSVLTKVAVGIDGQVLVASSVAATGLNWATAPGGKIQNIASLISMVDASNFTSVYSVTIPASTLGTNNAVRATSYVNFTQFTSSIHATVYYGGGYVSSVMLTAPDNAAMNASGQIKFTLIANNSASLQRGILEVNASAPQNFTAPLPHYSVIARYVMNTASVNSAIDQNLGMQLKGGQGDVLGTIHATTVEKIT